MRSVKSKIFLHNTLKVNVHRRLRIHKFAHTTTLGHSTHLHFTRLQLLSVPHLFFFKFYPVFVRVPVFARMKFVIPVRTAPDLVPFDVYAVKYDIFVHFFIFVGYRRYALVGIIHLHKRLVNVNVLFFFKHFDMFFASQVFILTELVYFEE